MNNKEALKSFALKAKRRLVGKENNITAKIKVISNEDVEFKNKVEYILSQDDVITNPVQYLMDERVMKNMDENEKERYLLNTLDKYNSLRNQIENLGRESKFCM